MRTGCGTLLPSDSIPSSIRSVTLRLATAGFALIAPLLFGCRRQPRCCRQTRHDQASWLLGVAPEAGQRDTDLGGSRHVADTDPFERTVDVLHPVEDIRRWHPHF